MGKYIGIISGILLVASVIGYSYLGGFAKPELSVTEIPKTTIWGKAYEGDIQNKEMGKIFDEYAEAAKKYNTVMCAVYYNDPDKNKGKIKAFIGIKMAAADSLAGAEKREFEFKKAIKAVLNSSYLVAPVKIYPTIQEYAKDNNLEATDFAIETYPSDKQMIVEVPVK